MLMVTASPMSLWSIFSAKAELLGAAVMRTASSATAATLLEEAAPGFSCTDSVGRRYAGIGAQAARSTREPVAEMVAAGLFAIAETGSVAVDEPAVDRGACFLAERLWLLVPEREMVATLDQGMQRMHALVRGGSRHPLLMSGPSRTADIERVLTIGVHGPRRLVILAIGDS